MWSDFRAALWAIAEENAAASASSGVAPEGSSGGFGTPPPANILALVPHEQGS